MNAHWSQPEKLPVSLYSHQFLSTDTIIFSPFRYHLFCLMIIVFMNALCENNPGPLTIIDLQTFLQTMSRLNISCPPLSKTQTQLFFLQYTFSWPPFPGHWFPPYLLSLLEYINISGHL